MKSISLVILAAGIGSRYGGDKQTDGFGPNGESIMEYAIYDAIKAGFNKIVLVIRKEIQQELQQYFYKRLPKGIEIDFAIQDIKSFVHNELTIERNKPWGTGHALLCCKDVVDGPFGLINADDFYGRSALVNLSAFIDRQKEKYALVAYTLADVLSANGPVSRGVLTTDDENNLKSIKEFTGLIAANGHATSLLDKQANLSLSSLCSMNCWALHPDIFKKAESMFNEFLANHSFDAKREFYLPSIVEALINEKSDQIKVLKEGKEWFGVTYPEDKQIVKMKLAQLTTEGKYPSPLWIDLFE